MPSNPTLSQNELVTPLFDGKLCIILFIVGDSGFETEAGFSVIVLVGKPLRAKGRQITEERAKTRKKDD